MGADNDKELTLLIKLMGDTYGADKVDEAIRKTKGEFHVMAGTATHGAEKIKLSHHELRFALRQFGGEVGHLGHMVMEGLHNPVVLALMAFGLLFKFLSSQFEKMKKMHEEFKAAVEKKIDVSANIQAAKDEAKAWDESFKSAQEAIAAFQEKLRALREGPTKTDQAEKEAAHEIAEAKRTAAMAEAKVEASQKEKTENMKLRGAGPDQMSALEAEGKSRVEAVKNAEAQATIDAKKKEAKAIEAIERPLDIDAGTKEARFGRASTAVGSLNDRKGALDKSIDDLTKWLAENGTKYQNESEKSHIDEQRHQLRVAFAERAKLTDEQLPSAQRELGSAQTDMDRAHSEQEAVVAKKRALAEEISEMEKDLQSKKEVSEAERKGSSAAERAAAGFDTARTGPQTAQLVISGEEKIARNEPITKEELQAIEAAKASMDFQRKSQAEQIKVFTDMRDLHMDHATKMQEIMAELGVLKNNLKKNRSTFAGG